MTLMLRALRALLLTLVVAFVGLAIYVFIGSERRLNKTYDMAVPPSRRARTARHSRAGNTSSRP
jgi:hypothetical protein